MKYNAMRTSQARIDPYSREKAKTYLKSIGMKKIDQETCLDELITSLREFNELHVVDEALTQRVPQRISSLAVLALTNEEGFYDCYMGSAIDAHMSAKVGFIPPEESDYFLGVIKFRGQEIPFG